MSSEIEKRRLAALDQLGLLDTPDEERFERLTRIAQQHYDTKIALLSLVAADRQWFKSRRGIALSETPRALSLCDHVIRQDGPFVIEDTLLDPRFRHRPLILADTRIRFYAGVPIREPSGFKVGALCIVDDRPRRMEGPDLDILTSLAAIADDELRHCPDTLDTANRIPQAMLNRAIQRAQNVFGNSTSQHSALSVVLGDLVRLTGSTFGFIGEVQNNASGLPYLQINAISNIAWSAETGALYAEVERRGMRFERLDTLIGAALLSSDVVISHDLPNDPRSSGLPPGHPPVHSYMAMPVFSGDQRIGLVGLANRKPGYQARLASELQPLLQTVGNLIERERLHRERASHQKDLEHATHYDTLTGLANRRRLGQLFEKEMRAADRRGGRLSICFLDLDDFKRINDEHGHAIGDAVLKSTAERLQKAVRCDDVVARMGGDEFVAILRDVGDARVYARLLEAVSQPLSYRNFVLGISASMGVTIYPADDADIDLLLRHADQAMYAAKESGKNRYELFDLQSHFSRKERVHVLEQIGRAIERDELPLYYQPRVDLVGRRVAGFEALIRWQHPREGLLGPNQFIPYLEYTEYADHVGRLVLRKAVAQLQAFARAGHDFSISVNLSPSHFLSGAFCTDLQSIIGDCTPELRRRLILEILETTTQDDLERVINTLATCRELGVEIALDDFGTGYSSLDYLRRLPAHEIKIDRSFVKDMCRNGDDAMLVSAIISMAERFNRRVVAEGIEDQATHVRLIEMGCELGQGYFYSRPTPAPDAFSWAKNFRWPPPSGQAG